MNKIIIAVIFTIMIVLAIFLLEPTGLATNKNTDVMESNVIEIDETTIKIGEIAFSNYTIVR